MLPAVDNAGCKTVGQDLYDFFLIVCKPFRPDIFGQSFVNDVKGLSSFQDFVFPVPEEQQ